MTNLQKLNSKLHTLTSLKEHLEKWKKNGDKIVFTNGCFDLLHRGHAEALANTADLGDRLIIGLNSDQSIKKLKGNNRPIIDEKSRSILLASFQFVDAIVLFSEVTPTKLIEIIMPDVLVKGGDYKIEEIAGYKTILQNGGKVITVPLVDGFSTSNIIHKIKKD